MTFGSCVAIIEKLSAAKRPRLISESAPVRSRQFLLEPRYPLPSRWAGRVLEGCAIFFFVSNFRRREGAEVAGPATKERGSRRDSEILVGDSPAGAT